MAWLKPDESFKLNEPAFVTPLGNSWMPTPTDDSTPRSNMTI